LTVPDPKYAVPHTRQTAATAAMSEPSTITTGVAAVKLSRPVRLISSASHSVREMRRPMPRPSIHGDQNPKNTMTTMMTTRRRNSICVAFMRGNPDAGV
jgi:hypothetical protein